MEKEKRYYCIAMEWPTLKESGQPLLIGCHEGTFVFEDMKTAENKMEELEQAKADPNIIYSIIDMGKDVSTINKIQLIL